MRANVINTSVQHHEERLYESLIGQTIDLETKLISAAISKNGKIEKQIEDVQAIMNEHRLNIIQQSLNIVESIATSNEVIQSYLNYKQIVEEHSAKYKQIQILHQMRNVLNSKIVVKIEILNKHEVNEEERAAILSELEKLNDSLEKVDLALSKLQVHWDVGIIGPGFSVLNDLQLHQSQQFETQRSYLTDFNNQNSQQKKLYGDKKEGNKEHEYADDEGIEESNIYADEAESEHETTQINLYATQDLNSNQNNNNNINANQQQYQSYQKPPKDDLLHSNLKLITPVAQRMHSIGYKTEPDSAMTPLHSADIIKINMYKTPQDNNNKNLFKNTLNNLHQSNFESHEIQTINSNERENNDQDSYNPPAMQGQISETVSAGDLISPPVPNNEDRHQAIQDCTSFNKSEESTTKHFSINFEVGSSERQSNILTFGNHNLLSNHLRTGNSNQGNSLFTSKLQTSESGVQTSETQTESQDNQQMKNKNKLIDMFDACLNSLQQPELMTMKQQNTIKNQQTILEKGAIEDEKIQDQSIDEFVLHEKEIMEDLFNAKFNKEDTNKVGKRSEEDTIKFNGVNISNVQEIDEFKADNSFFSQREFYMTQTNYNSEKDNKKEQQMSVAAKQEGNFVTTFGVNESTDDPQQAYLEKKFGKDHFEVNNFASQKELEDKILLLQKQLFQTNALDDLGHIIKRYQSDSAFEAKSKMDTIKPVVTRQEELEALGLKGSPDVEQFKIVEESPEFKPQNDSSIQSKDNSARKDESQENENENTKGEVKKRNLFEESNKFYSSFDEETLKEIQQQKYQKSEELQTNNQIGEEAEEEDEEEYCNQVQQQEEEEEEEQYEEDLKQSLNGNEESLKIPRSTLSENQFMQPFSKEIPQQNYADEYDDLVNSFLNKANSNTANNSIKSNELSFKNSNSSTLKQKDKLPSAFDSLNKYLEQQNQIQKQNNFENTFGVNLAELALNNSKKSSSVKQENKEISPKLEDIEDVDEEKPNENIPKQQLLHDSVRQKEYRKCRVFNAEDFLKNTMRQKSEIEQEGEEEEEEVKENEEIEDIEINVKQIIEQFDNANQIKGDKQANKNANEDILAPALNKIPQLQQKISDRYNNKKPEDDEEGIEVEDDNDFERDDTPSFLDEFKKNVKSKLPLRNRLYQNFMSEAQSVNQAAQKIPDQRNAPNLDDVQEELDEEQQQQQFFYRQSLQKEFHNTAQFQQSNKQINQKTMSLKGAQKRVIKEEVQKQQEEVNEKDVEDIIENKEQEERKEQIEQQQVQFNEDMMDDYPLLFQNAQLQQLIQQQKSNKTSSSDLTKTAKFAGGAKSTSTSSLQSSLKSQKQPIYSGENKANQPSTVSAKTSSISAATKKMPPKKPITGNLPPSSSSTSSLGQARKINNSLTQLPVSQPQPHTEKENYKSLQNSEVKSKKQEITEQPNEQQQQQSNLQKTLKGVKPKIPTTTEKPKKRSSSIRNEEPEDMQIQYKSSSGISQKSFQPQIPQYQFQDDPEQQGQKVNSSTPSSRIKTQITTTNTTNNTSANTTTQVGKKLTNSSVILNKKSQDK